MPAAGRGFDGGKKVNGRKRHIVVDTLGLLLAVMVTAASVTDREAGRTLLERLRERHWRISLVWADGGYTGRLVGLARDVLRIALTVVRRTDDTTGFVVLPKRWLVERTFAWLMHSRRLARDHESRTDTSEAMIRWSMSMVVSRRLARRARGTSPGVPRPASQPASPAPPGASPSTALPRPSPRPPPAPRPPRDADSPSPPRSPPGPPRAADSPASASRERALPSRREPPFRAPPRRPAPAVHRPPRPAAPPCLREVLPGLRPRSDGRSRTAPTRLPPPAARPAGPLPAAEQHVRAPPAAPSPTASGTSTEETTRHDTPSLPPRRRHHA